MSIVKAGAEELIWVVVGIFWVIAQIAGSSKKKKAPPFRVNPQGEPRPMDEEKGGPAEDPFADLMRKLTGVQEIKAPTTPESTPLPRAVPLPRKGEMHLASAPSPEPMPAPKPKPITEVAEVDIRPTMSSFRSIMPAMKLPSMKMSFRPSDPRYSESAFGDAERPKSTPISPMLGKIINPADKRTLRRAMLSHIIFSPPKALEQ